MSPGRSRRSRADREAELVAAAWQVVDTLSLPEALGGFTASEVSRTAGVSTGSLFHHFANMGELAEAMLADLFQDTDVYREPESLSEDTRDQNVLDLVHESMMNRWKRLWGDPDRRAQFRHELVAALNHAQPVEPDSYRGKDLQSQWHHASAEGPPKTVGDVLRSRFEVRERAAGAVWTEVIGSVGRTIVEPFDGDRLTTGVGALLYGLAMRRLFDPDAVDDELLADMTSALLAALTKPMGSDRNLGDAAESFGRQIEGPSTPQGRSGARRRAETRAHVIADTIGLFNRGWESITASEIAERAQVSSQTISNVFGDPRAVAASTFVVHLDTIEGAFADAAAGGDLSDPDVALPAIRAHLRALAQCALEDPEPARALLSERLAAIRHTGEARGTGDIRVEVPVTRLLNQALKELWPNQNEVAMGRTLTHSVLCQAVVGADNAEAIADQVMRMLPSPIPSQAPLD